MQRKTIKYPAASNEASNLQRCKASGYLILRMKLHFFRSFFFNIFIIFKHFPSPIRSIYESADKAPKNPIHRKGGNPMNPELYYEYFLFTSGLQIENNRRKAELLEQNPPPKRSLSSFFQRLLSPARNPSGPTRPRKIPDKSINLRFYFHSVSVTIKPNR